MKYIGDIQVIDGQLYFGNSAPDASAVFDLSQSTDKGFLIPNLTTVQRDAIAAPAEGLFVYNTDTSTLDYYNGSTWGTVAGGTNISATTSDTLTINSDSDAAILDTTGLTNNRTFDFPDISGAFIVNAGAQNIGGIKTFTDDVKISATKKLYLDGGGDTYILENSANDVRLFVGGVNTLTSTATNITLSQDTSIPSTKKLYLDGAGDTYIHESAANVISAYAGGARAFYCTNTYFAIEPTNQLYLDGGGDTYITEGSANTMSFYVGGTHQLRMESGFNKFLAGNLSIEPTNQFYLDGGGDTYITEGSANTINFYRGGQHQFRMTTGLNNFLAGHVTIESTNALYLDGGDDTYINEYAANTIGFVSSGARVLEISQPNGGIYPGLDNTYDCGIASQRWNDIYATNGTIQTSDANEKDNIVDSDLGLDFITNLRPVKYKWKDTETQSFSRPHYGLIAQEVKEVLDEIVECDFAGYVYSEDSDSHGLRYQEFIAPMIAAIKELKSKNDDLEARLEALEG